MEVNDVHVGELLVELSDSLLGEVGRNEEVAVSDQEVWVGFFDVGLQWLLQVLADLREVSSLVENLSVQLLESTLLWLSLAHDL